MRQSCSQFRVPEVGAVVAQQISSAFEVVPNVDGAHVGRQRDRNDGGSGVYVGSYYIEPHVKQAPPQPGRRFGDLYE